MKPWLARIVTVLFVLSLLATPQIAATAQEPAATPILVDDVQPGSGEGTPVEPDSSPDSSEGEPDPASVSTPENQEQQRPTRSGEPEMGINALGGTYTVTSPFYDLATNSLAIAITFNVGFSAEAGDSIVIGYDSWLQMQPSAQASLTNVPSAMVTLDDWNNTITITFSAAYSVAGEGVTGYIEFPAVVSELQCWPRTESYFPNATLYYWWPGNFTSQYVESDEECLAITETTIDWASYDADDGMMEIEILNIGPPVAGQQVTLTYPTDKLSIEPGPFEVLRYSYERERDEVVGYATASNGLITITFIDTGIEGEWSDWAYVELPGSMISASCGDSTDTFITDYGDLEFVSNTGAVFTDGYPSVMCNAAPASKTGEFGTDSEGNTIIIWTIDTGDIYRYGNLDDYVDYSGYWFDCDAYPPVVETISGSFEYDVWDCYTWGVDIDFWSTSDDDDSQIFRAKVTITSIVDEEYTPASYINCVEIESDLWGDQDRMSAAAASNGYGGEACYELFAPESEGDVITKTVDKAEAEPGDTLTYTITASTSADNWGRITLTDTLPAGVAIDPDSITCVVEPAMFGDDPCFTLTGSSITASAWSTFDEEYWNYISGPVVITITMQGTVTAAPGSTIVNEACSQRHIQEYRGEGPELAAMNMGDPTVPGGGVICESAVTNVPLPPTPSPTPSPSPSPTPVTPTPPATPSASPTIPATPDPTATATSAVTGLPETGNGVGSAHGITLLLAAMAASILVAGAIGLRSRADSR